VLGGLLLCEADSLPVRLAGLLRLCRLPGSFAWASASSFCFWVTSAALAPLRLLVRAFFWASVAASGTAAPDPRRPRLFQYCRVVMIDQSQYSNMKISYKEHVYIQSVGIALVRENEV